MKWWRSMGKRKWVFGEENHAIIYLERIRLFSNRYLNLLMKLPLLHPIFAGKLLRSCTIDSYRSISKSSLSFTIISVSKICNFICNVCFRSIVTKFESFSEYKGIKTFRFNATLGDMSSDPSLKCFCQDDTHCLKQGVMDLAPCTGNSDNIEGCK